MKPKIQIKEITQHVQAMVDRNSFLEVDKSGIRPAFAKEISKILLLMEWPLFSEKTKSWIRAYGVVIPHGKTSIIETFFVRSKKESDFGGEYLGSHRVFTIQFPKNKYNESYDHVIAESLAEKMGLFSEASGCCSEDGCSCESGCSCEGGCS